MTQIPHHLFVREDRAVVHQRQAVCGVAVPTHRGFGDAAAVHLYTRTEGADLAAEKGFLHLRDELRGADHHAADGDELIDVWKEIRHVNREKSKHPTRQTGRTPPRGGLTLWVEAAHVPGFQGVVGTHLDLVLQDGIREAIEEQLIDCHVQGWNYFLLMKKGGKSSFSFLCSFVSHLPDRGLVSTESRRLFWFSLPEGNR